MSETSNSTKIFEPKSATSCLQIEKSYIIQTALLSEEKRLDDDPISKVLCWSDVDLRAAAYTSLIRSQSEVIKEFNNFIEPWENNLPTEEDSFGNHRRLLRK